MDFNNLNGVENLPVYKVNSMASDKKGEVDVTARAEIDWLEGDAKIFMVKACKYISQPAIDFVFACVPDMHMCFEFMENYHLKFLKYAEKLNNQCNLLVSSGDILFNGRLTITKQDLLATYLPKYKRMIQSFADEGIAFIAGLGGHDFNCFNRVGNIDYSETNNLTKAEQRTHLIQPCIDAINNNSYLSTRYEAVISDNTDVCYYYVRDKKTGHYTVMLDETDHPYTIVNGNLVYDTYSTVCYQQAQLQWIVDLLQSVPEGKYVAFHNHMGINVGSANDVGNTCKALREIITAYINRTTYAGGSGSDSRGLSWNLSSADFSQCKGMIVGVFKGHIHTQTYELVNGTIHQIGSTNPDMYPFNTNTYCYTSMYSGDVYVVRDREIRNFHYGRNSYKDGGSQSWNYNAFTDRWISLPKTVANNEPAAELDENFEIVETLTTVKRTQNNQWYFPIPQNGSLLGEIKIYSTAITSVPSTVGQYTLTDGSYTPTGGDYVAKGVVSYDSTSGLLTINDSGVIVARSNGYIMIANNLTQDSIAYIVREKQSGGTDEPTDEPSGDNDEYEIVSEIPLIQRSQNNRWYLAIAADGVNLGEVLVKSDEITSIPYSVSQATYANDSYTWTGGDYKNKGLVSYDETSGVLTINDNGTISRRANGYILVDNNFTSNSKGYIVKLKET